MTTTTAPAPELTLWISAYGGWNWDKSTGSSVRVVFQGPEADAMAAEYVRTHGHLTISGDEHNEWDAFPLVTAALYPQCEHGMSLWLCAGPGHYPADHN
jgi:hypothetical protein